MGNKSKMKIVSLHIYKKLQIKNFKLRTVLELIKDYVPRIDEKASSDFLLANIQLIAKQALEE